MLFSFNVAVAIPKYLLKEYTKFLLLRHPFSRLVAAYWDKMSMAEHNVHYRHIRQSLIKLLRPEASTKEVLSSHPTFEEFVRAVLNPHWTYHNDRHWRSAVEMCSPCAIRYDYILYLEKGALEFEPMLQRLSGGNIDMYNKLSSLVKPANKKSKLATNQIQTSRILRDFKNLTSRQIAGVMDKYRIDMQLFGYTFDRETFEIDLN